jgi:hypothetical protein
MDLKRVIFRDGQVLHAADLNAEGAYRLSLRRRHDASAHGWGIVSGLTLEIESGGFVVNPGFAWDGYGRSLILPDEIFRPWALPGGGSDDIFSHLGSLAVDVWLLYHREPESRPRHCDEVEPTRLHETARLCYTPGLTTSSQNGDHPGDTLRGCQDIRRAELNPRRPRGIPPGEPPFSPEKAPPDDPDCLWPIYLGSLIKVSVERKGESPAVHYCVDEAQRPCATLVGQHVTSASRQPRPEVKGAASAPIPVPRAEFVLDGETQLPRPRRFAVIIPDENGEPVERLVLRQPGGATLRGDTLLSRKPSKRMFEEPSTLTFAKPPTIAGQKRYASTLGFAPLAAPPEAATPWSIYRTDVPKDEESRQPERHQLRIEFNYIGEPEHPERSQFAIGYMDSTGDSPVFVPCLAVDESCTVRVKGKMRVDGDLTHRVTLPGAGGGPGSIGTVPPSAGGVPPGQAVVPSTLEVTINDLRIDGDRWFYTVRITNADNAATLRWIVVLDAFRIGDDPVSDTRIVGGLLQLEANESKDVLVTHETAPSDLGLVSITVTVIAFTPTNQTMYETAAHPA